MRILVLSDSHGAVEACRLVVEQSAPDQILHLGDCVRDAERLHALFPAIPLTGVPGNCDCRPEEPAEKLLFLGDCRVLICHGHTCGVKTSLLTAGLKAEQDHLDAFLFGHTHKPLVDKRGRTLFLNPGAVGKGLRPTYGILTVEGDRIDGRTVFLDSES